MATRRTRVRPAGAGSSRRLRGVYGTSSALPLNTWSHLAATYDGATLRLYVNGTQVASTAVLGAIETSTGALTIGGDSLYGQYFAGRIDEVRIYNTALTPPQIQTDMNTPIGGTGPPDTEPPSDADGLGRDRGVAEPDQPLLDGVDGQRRRDWLPGRALPGCGLLELRPGRDPDRHHLQRHRTQRGDDLSLPRARGRCRRQSQRLHGDPERDDAGHAGADRSDRAERDGGLRESDQSLAGRRRPTTSQSPNYRVERCQGATCTNFVQIATPTGTTYNDTGLTTATTYRYRVRAADAAGNLSGYSAIQNAATTDTQAPTDPTGLSATAVSQSQINLAWTGSTDNVAVANYRVERCQGAACTTFVQVGTPTGTTYNDTGLSAATTYRYRVRAADAAGNLSGYTAIENATTPDTQAPTAPTGLTATAASASQIDLAWTASTDNVAVTGYRVERCQGAACTNFARDRNPDRDRRSQDTGLAAATTYRYRVRAADAAGNLSGYSAIQNAATTDTQPPTDPTGLTATAVSGTQIDLAWTGSTDNVAVANYRVERCQGAGCTNFVQVATPTGHDLQRHRPQRGDDLPLPRARRRCGRQPERLHGGCRARRRRTRRRRRRRPDWRRPPAPRARSTSAGRRRPTTSPSLNTGSSAARERRVRTSSRWQPRPRRATATPASWRRRPTATASALSTRPAI